MALHVSGAQEWPCTGSAVMHLMPEREEADGGPGVSVTSRAGRGAAGDKGHPHAGVGRSPGQPHPTPPHSRRCRGAPGLHRAKTAFFEAVVRAVESDERERLTNHGWERFTEFGRSVPDCGAPSPGWTAKEVWFAGASWSPGPLPKYRGWDRARRGGAVAAMAPAPQLSSAVSASPVVGRMVLGFLSTLAVVLKKNEFIFFFNFFFENN